MPLTLTLTEAETERVREMALLASYQEAADLCTAALLNDGQMQIVKDDIVEWEKVRTNVNDVIPTTQNELYVSRKAKRRLLRWSMRQRLGLDPVSDLELEMEAVETASSGKPQMSVGIVRFQTGRPGNTNVEL